MAERFCQRLRLRSRRETLFGRFLSRIGRLRRWQWFISRNLESWLATLHLDQPVVAESFRDDPAIRRCQRDPPFTPQPLVGPDAVTDAAEKIAFVQFIELCGREYPPDKLRIDGGFPAGIDVVELPMPLWT